MVASECMILEPLRKLTKVSIQTILPGAFVKKLRQNLMMVLKTVRVAFVFVPLEYRTEVEWL